MSDTSSDSSSNTWMIVGCCCLFLVLIGAVIGYMYKMKGIRSNNLSLIKCAFSSTPLVGTWKGEHKVFGKSSLNISYSSPNYTIIMTSTSIGTNPVEESSTIQGTLSGSDLSIINPDPNSKVQMRGVLDGLTLKMILTSPPSTDFLSIVYNKVSC